ncbi:YheC/YheD family protein [Peribacillus frigoritolerans]|uniref:YheC/YheD family endospore coat-associated protein n=1 Tax=Peribacillus frigoritolerans TaxID=450367 RepID=UPI0020795BE1|nr:YheC/YheD family protein [Peribacillus frigoritolerans]USK81444.1 YheC/YheD family protein [Peribacillus frigoritolerans]WJE48724.1 YheC/YheD family protein [Peribacillus frigoritolerans]
MRKTYPAEIAAIPGNVLYYPSELGDLADIELIYFGRHSCPAIVKQNPAVNQTIVLSESLAESLLFDHTDIPLHLFIYGKSIHIGPLVGIFSSGFTGLSNKPLGERSEFFAKLLSLSKTTGCIPFVFGENVINWDEETIKGYVFDKDDWNIHEFPFPNVIYDRLPNRLTENRDGPKEVKQKFQKKYTIPWYNPGFFNKWDVNERLCADERALPYLPETYPFQSISVVETLLSHYRQVYIKPIHGSLGLGIHQILYDKHENVYYCRYTNEAKENKLQRFSTLESIVKHIFHDRPLENLIVQQGIPLIRSEKRPVDFRVHTNKDSNGKWQVTAIAAKIAGAGSVTTHIKSGGVIKTVAELFGDDEEATEVERKLSEAALILSESIEKNLDGIIAEIGFDFGLDKKGQVWMFEANSKPGRSIFSHPKLKDFELLTRKLSLDYAIYLTEQTITKSIRVPQ